MSVSVLFRSTITSFPADEIGTEILGPLEAYLKLVMIGEFNVLFSRIWLLVLSTTSSLSSGNVIVLFADGFRDAAILSVIFLKERIPVRTWVTILICFLAVGLVFAGRLDGGHLFGNFAALISAIGLGTHFVLVRLKREVDMTPAIGLASLLTCFIGFNMSSDLYLEPQQLGFLAILGLILLPISFILLTRAPIYISAPEVSLIILLETILAPIWVWLAIQEEPPLTTLIGGGIIIIALAIHAIQSRNNR